jgi:poly(3-hydroxyalkanoate) synthetase
MECGISYGSLAMLVGIASMFVISWYKEKQSEKKQLGEMKYYSEGIRKQVV